MNCVQKPSVLILGCLCLFGLQPKLVAGQTGVNLCFGPEAINTCDEFCLFVSEHTNDAFGEFGCCTGESWLDCWCCHNPCETSDLTDCDDCANMITLVGCGVGSGCQAQKLELRGSSSKAKKFSDVVVKVARENRRRRRGVIQDNDSVLNV